MKPFLTVLCVGLLAGLVPFATAGMGGGTAYAPAAAPPSSLRQVAAKAPLPPATKDASLRAASTKAAAPGRPRIAVVIDDLGLDRPAFEAVNALPGPLTLAFLPYGEDAQSMLDAVDPRHEPILHLPTEPILKLADAGPDMLSPGDRRRIERTLEANLDKLHGYAGVNNHTGSRFTADKRAMSVLLAALDERGLYFLDSVTTPDRVAASIGEEAGFRVLERDVFLDADPAGGAPYVAEQLARVEAIAEAHGTAIAIAHPYDGTLDALGPWLAEAEAKGFELVPLGALMPPRQPAHLR